MAQNDDNREDGRGFEEVLESLTDGSSFESFLERKTSTWKADPVSELKTIPVLSETIAERIAAVNAADNSSSETTSSSQDETEDSPSRHAAQNAVEKQTKIELHNHPIVGQYVTETVEEVSVDSEWQQEFTKTRDSALILPAEEIIDMRHKLNRAVFLINARQQGLKIALEEVLQSRNSSDRQALLDLDRKYRAKPKATKKDKAKSEKQGSSISKASKAKGSKGQKTADTLKSIGMDREAIENKLRELDLLDDLTANHVAKMFA